MTIGVGHDSAITNEDFINNSKIFSYNLALKLKNLLISIDSNKAGFLI